MLARNKHIPPEQFGRVAVVMGGWSAEREISLRSGNQILSALQQLNIDAVAVDADRDVVNVLVAEGFDRVFLTLHGRGGEDGKVQGALELAGLPYTGSGVLGSALAMDKIRAKRLCQHAGIATAEWRSVTDVTDAVKKAQELGFPVIVKPVFEGSSIGVSKARENEVSSAFELACQYGDVMLERFIDGTEVTAAVIDGEALPLVSMKTPRLFYDYEAKYFSDTTEYECPCKLDASVELEIKQSALKAYDALSARGCARVDFMLDRQNNPFFMELNTAPGMTDHSLVPMAAKAAGIDFNSLCERILASTLVEEQTA